MSVTLVFNKFRKPALPSICLLHDRKNTFYRKHGNSRFHWNLTFPLSTRLCSKQTSTANLHHATLWNLAQPDKFPYYSVVQFPHYTSSNEIRSDKDKVAQLTLLLNLERATAVWMNKGDIVYKTSLSISFTILSIILLMAKKEVNVSCT